MNYAYFVVLRHAWNFKCPESQSVSVIWICYHFFGLPLLTIPQCSAINGELRAIYPIGGNETHAEMIDKHDFMPK